MLIKKMIIAQPRRMLSVPPPAQKLHNNWGQSQIVEQLFRQTHGMACVCSEINIDQLANNCTLTLIVLQLFQVKSGPMRSRRSVQRQSTPQARSVRARSTALTV